MILDISYRMSDNSRQLRRIFDERVRSLGLTAAQARMLLFLNRFPGEKQGFYAERLEVEPITLTRLVDRMEDAGWLERCADPEDRRANLLQLTEKSHDVVSGLRAIVEGLFEEVLDGLGSTERETLSSLLETIGANLVRARAQELIDG